MNIRILHFTMRHSIATYAGNQTPNLPDSELLVLNEISILKGDSNPNILSPSNKQSATKLLPVQYFRHIPQSSKILLRIILEAIQLGDPCKKLRSE